MLARYLPEQSCLSFIPYLKIGCRMNSNCIVLQSIVFTNEGRDGGRELGILHIDSEALHVNKANFVVSAERSTRILY